MALSTQGSTLMAVAQSLIDAAEATDITSAAILSHNRDLSLRGAEIDYVDYTERSPREWFTRAEQGIDVIAGGAGLVRPYFGRLYDPAVVAAEKRSGSVVLLYEGHYASATLPRWQSVRNRSTVVLYVHNPLSRSYSRRELRRLLGHADAVIFCADHLREDVERRLGGSSPVELLTVHNGVDQLFFPDPGAPAEPFTIVFAGRPVQNKGTHLVLEAAEVAAARSSRELRVEIIGSDTYGYETSTLTDFEKELRVRAEKLTVPVRFIPFLEKAELARHLRRAGVVCLPSQWAEGLPLVALEAMASGVPVVTSDSAGMVEAVADAGFVVPGGDPQGMGERIAALAGSDVAWREARERSLIRAQAFSWQAAAETFAGLMRR
ncbi:MULTISPECIES: glycosyltransferase family 4 protein [Microbacterium]|uniref:glycosyltransferase family 4 protein n=1 Tax=uncultured Microbacterium sp. TaxID=191216 RepID=UPI00260A3D5D|nr:glycosyltransferase family 4 protein [uncultured Microbacterium sp.]